ncbi:hypothetical protein IC229_18480 [Spirosoma sp. BT702]|uniref:Uncharacterized protein n=1 Tax=Spirosoma profusum TaxID=2771354 RepID=A0A926XYL7_9BACT|nr:hypothetical protein [Spirosoma profusum]MBD2702640.1 hypothetical protein [Spirosoma profusum]
MAPSLLDLPISFFEFDHKRHSFGNVPTQKTTLRRMATTRYYQPQVEAICAEVEKAKQDELKKYLSAFTPVALLRDRKASSTIEEKIIHQWSMLMGDVDIKDNPGVDMAELKKLIANLPYVLLCAYSVRRGLWFVVRLPDHQTPETLKAHFRYLQKLFTERFGITLDSTKGCNATDLRFASFDEAPYLNDEASVMKGTYTPPAPKRGPIHYGGSSDDNQQNLLKRLIRFVDRAGEGQRHETLLKAAKLAGGYIAADRMDEDTAVLALETAASEWPQFSKSQKTIRDGIRYGLTSPVHPEVNPNPPQAWKREVRKGRPQPVSVSAQPFNDESASEWKPFQYTTRRIEAEVIAEEPTFLSVVRKVSDSPEPLIVKTIAEQLDNPGSILRPDESQLEREFPVGADIPFTEDYPPEIDEPSPPGAVPQIKEIKPKNGDYSVWQRSPESPFYKLGLASLPTKQQS